jgi:hypothetical protein
MTPIKSRVAGGNVDRAFEAVLDQLRQVGRVVDVGVADDGEVDVRGVDAGGQALLEVGLLVLDGQAEVGDETGDLVLFVILEEIHRTSDSVSCTENV